MSSSLTGSTGKVPGYNVSQLSRFTPQQMKLFEQLIGGSMGGLGSGLEHLSKLAGGDQSYFEQLEAPAQRQFGALQGNLASRFSGMGTGARRSSGFGNAASSASQEFAEKLQSNRLGMQNQAIQELLGLSQSLLGQNAFENVVTQKQEPAWKQFLMGMAPGLGQGLGMGARAFMGGF